MGFSRRGGAKRPASDRAYRAGEGSARLRMAVAVMLLSAGVISPTYAYQAADSLPAASETASGKSVDLDLANADLSLVVDAIQRQTNANIVVQTGDKPFGKVNVHLTNVPLDRALQNVALSAGASLTKDPDGTYVLRAGDPEAPAVEDVPAPRPRSNEADFHWYKLVLQHAVPNKVLYLLHWDSGIRDDSPFPRTPHDQSGAPLSVRPSVVLMDGSNVPSVPGGSGQSGPTQANRSVDGDASQQAQQFPGGFGGGGFGGGGFGGGGFPGGGGGFPGGGGLQQPGVGPGGGIGRGGQQLPADVDEIIALQADNSLLIKATPDAFNRIREIIKYIDIAPRQVQIRVEFVRADVNDVDQFGINYSFVPYPGVTATSDLGQGGASYGINFAVGNVVGSMLATLTHGRAKVLNAPIITTTNNVDGNITVTNEIPYTTTTTVVPNGGQAVSNQTINFEPIQTTLDVTPRINSDDSITLPLTLSLPSIGAQLGNTGAVAVNQQDIRTVRTVKSGETMVLGGMINDTESVTRTSIPILGDLPIIGSLFRNRDRSVNNSELLIFVTPTIIGEDNGAATAAAGGSVTP